MRALLLGSGWELGVPCSPPIESTGAWLLSLLEETDAILLAGSVGKRPDYEGLGLRGPVRRGTTLSVCLRVP
jgi:hypothetical protein